MIVDRTRFLVDIYRLERRERTVLLLEDVDRERSVVVDPPTETVTGLDIGRTPDC